MLEAAQMK